MVAITCQDDNSREAELRWTQAGSLQTLLSQWECHGPPINSHYCVLMGRRVQARASSIWVTGMPHGSQAHWDLKQNKKASKQTQPPKNGSRKFKMGPQFHSLASSELQYEKGRWFPKLPPEFSSGWLLLGESVGRATPAFWLWECDN